MSAVQNKKYPETFRCILTTILLLASATGIGWLFRSVGFAASFIAIFAFNFCFTREVNALVINAVMIMIVNVIK